MEEGTGAYHGIVLLLRPLAHALSLDLTELSGLECSLKYGRDGACGGRGGGSSTSDCDTGSGECCRALFKLVALVARSIV